MNHRGQVLVIFIIFIPIFTLVLSLIIDIGYLQIKKNNIDDVVFDATKFYLNSSDSDKEIITKKLINKNINTNDIHIEDTNFYVKISVNLNIRGILRESNYKVTYTGNKNDLKIIKG